MANEEQIEYWNDNAGPQWVREQERLDATVVIHGDVVLERADLEPGHSVLDVGCGTGQTTVAAAKAVGTAGRVVGADVSRVMLDAARRRAATEGCEIELLEVDAQEADLGDAGFDRAISRFGVMFFDDPSRAFANIRGACRPGGRLTFVCWQSLQNNPWVAIPARALFEVIPPPEPDPHAPGPFAFADPDRVRTILEGAGWSDVRIEGVERRMGFGDGGLTDTLDFLANIGPVASTLRRLDDEALARKALAAVERTLEEHAEDGKLTFSSATWLVQAQNGG